MYTKYHNLLGPQKWTIMSILAIVKISQNEEWLNYKNACPGFKIIMTLCVVSALICPSLTSTLGTWTGR